MALFLVDWASTKQIHRTSSKSTRYDEATGTYYQHDFYSTEEENRTSLETAMRDKC